MIIKATLITLVVILIVVIATSYYVNKEGFDDITNTSSAGSLSTGTARRQQSKLNELSMEFQSFNRPEYGPQEPTCNNPLEQRYTKIAYDFDKLNDSIRLGINNIAKPLDTVLKVESSLPTDINDMQIKIRDIIDKIAPRSPDPNLKPNNPDFNLLFRYSVQKAAFEVLRVVTMRKIQLELENIIANATTPENKSTAQELLTSLKASLSSFINNMNSAITKMNDSKFIEPTNNSATSPASSTTAATPATTPATTPVTTPATTPVTTPATTLPAITSADITSALATPGATTAAATPASGSSPTRTEVVPQVSLSENGYNALMLQQKADILKDLQKVVRNEVLANRNTTPMLHNDGYGCGAEDEYKYDHKDGCEPVKEPGCGDNTWENECGKKSTKDKVTAAISQGKEYENSCYKDKKSKAACPPQPDMAQFIKKDAIPCWGCALDY